MQPVLAWGHARGLRPERRPSPAVGAFSRAEDRPYHLCLHRVRDVDPTLGRPLPRLRRLEHLGRGGRGAGRPTPGVRAGHPGRGHHRRRPPGRCAPADRRGRAGPGARRRPGRRQRGAARGRARDRQVDPAARGAGRARRRRPGPLRLRRGVPRAGAPARRAPRRPPPGPAAGRRDRPRRDPHPHRRRGPARGGGAQDPRAPRRRGVELRRRPAPRAAPGPLHQEPLRPGIRGRLLRDDRGRPGALGRPFPAVHVRAPGRGARGGLHREPGGPSPARHRGPGPGGAHRRADAEADRAGARPGAPRDPGRRARAAGPGGPGRPGRVRGDRRRRAPDRAGRRPRHLPGPGLGSPGVAGARRPGRLRGGRARRRGTPGAPAPPAAGRGGPAGLPARARPRRHRGARRQARGRGGRLGDARPVHLARVRARAGPARAAGCRGCRAVPGGAPMTCSQCDDRLIQVLQQVAPGTHLREGLERILRAEKGALVVLGAAPQVQALFTGGFRIEVPFTAQRLSELAKMDGALVLDQAGGNILWANVHLMPDPNIPTSETGTRHRTAERVAKQTNVPVVTVSESMHILTLYLDDLRHVLENVANVLSRGNQTVQTLEHYRARFDELAGQLTGVELDGTATQRDVLAVLARAEMLCRVAEELERYVAELGVDGRLLRLQLGELAEVAKLAPEELADPTALARVVNLTGDPEALDAVLVPRGYRVLAKVPELPGWVIDRVAERFGSLKVLLTASLEDLEEVEGIGRDRARQVRDGLGRLAEASEVEYYP